MSKFEICKKSDVSKFIESGTEFFVVDMDKKKVYSSDDLRLRELAQKIDSDNTFIVKEANYSF